ncbi:MAG: glucosaminidase domain-containing protein [Erysipelotrichaceae bacterium]
MNRKVKTIAVILTVCLLFNFIPGLKVDFNTLNAAEEENKLDETVYDKISEELDYYSEDSIIDEDVANEVIEGVVPSSIPMGGAVGPQMGPTNNIVRSNRSETPTYNIVQGNQTLGAYNNFEDANKAMNAQPVGPYTRMTFRNMTKAVSVGVVNFRTKSSGYNTVYKEEGTGYSGYINGSYGADAAYLGHNNNGTQVRFKMAGVIGWVAASDVEILDYNSAAVQSVNFYKVTNNRIYHYITTDVRGKNYVTKNDIGPAQSYMSTGQIMYSYDGHYFYTSYGTMINDYKNNTYSHSLNPSKPYYNYFQYVTHRTKTNFSANDMNQMIANFTSGTSSTMKNTGSDFITQQNIYGSNGILMLGVAANESNWGKSVFAIKRNNLFGHSAFDSNPNSASKYPTPGHSIAYHASKFVSQDFLDCKDVGGRYYGGNLGDKASGMNVKYASDPYWGEKAAEVGWYIEKRTGNQNIDANKYTIAIKNKNVSVPIYSEPRNNNKSAHLYSTPKNGDFPFVILGSYHGQSISGNDVWYRIQVDTTINSARTAVIQNKPEYNYGYNYGYIHSSLVNIVSGSAKPMTDYTFEYGTLTNVNGNLHIKGMMAIDAISNAQAVNNTYTLKLENISTGNIVQQPITRITNSKGRNPNSWFEGNINVVNLPQGDYRMHIVVNNGAKSETTIISNQLYAPQVTQMNVGNKNVTTRNDFFIKSRELQLIVRDEAIGSKNTKATLNQFDQAINISFSGNNMNIKGTSISVGANLANNQTIKRSIVFEDKATFKKYRYDLGSINNGPYKPRLRVSDGLDKTRGWYEKSVDVSTLPKGNYVIYIVNNNNVNDYGELVDKLYSKFPSPTINGKKYTFTAVKDQRFRVELKVS